MYDLKKVERVNELVKVIQEAEAQLEGIFGGEKPKRTWTRKAQPTEPPPETT